MPDELHDLEIEVSELRHKVHCQHERITNLEAALSGMWAMLRDIQPPDVQDGCNEMMRDFFENNTTLGGFSRSHFDCEVEP